MNHSLFAFTTEDASTPDTEEIDALTAAVNTIDPWSVLPESNIHHASYHFDSSFAENAKLEDKESAVENTDSAEDWAKQFAIHRQNTSRSSQQLTAEAFDQLLSTFHDFIRGTARQISLNAADPTDAFQELLNVGKTALWRNLCRWHPDQGRPFSKAFMDTYIRSQMFRALNKFARAVYLPEDVVKAVIDLHKATEEGEEEAMIASLADEMSWDRLNAILQHRHTLNRQSIMMMEDRESSSDSMSANTSYHIVTQAENDYCFDVPELLEEVLSELRPTERAAIESYYGLNNRTRASLEEIGKQSGVSRERIRQRIAAGFKKIKKQLVRKKIRCVDDILHIDLGA